MSIPNPFFFCSRVEIRQYAATCVVVAMSKGEHPTRSGPLFRVTYLHSERHTENVKAAFFRIGFGFLLTILLLGVPVSLLAQTSTYYFPQVADGGGYVTTFYFTSLMGANATVTVELFDPNGLGLSLS